MFDRVLVVNLDRRPDRLEAFNERFGRSGWPFLTPERVRAVDATNMGKPKWFRQALGAWACSQTYIRIFEDAMQDGIDSLFVFEDDALFCNDFADRLDDFTEELPDDWDAIYLGGILRGFKDNPPIRLGKSCHRIPQITGTYATAYRLGFLKRFYEWYWSLPRNDLLGVFDASLASFQAHRDCNIYGPMPWLCGHASGTSDINDRSYTRDHFFNYDGKTVECQADIGAIVNGRIVRPLMKIKVVGGKHPGEVRFGKEPTAQELIGVAHGAEAEE